MSQSFSLKTIRLTITLGKGVFSEGGNTKVIEGLACDCSVTKPGLPEPNSANVKIWGLKYEDMAQLTTLAFRPLWSHRNIITIEAGEVGKSLSMIFKGNIRSASADFNQTPDPVMSFECATGFFAQQIPVSASAAKGEAKATDLFGQWAQESGMTFQNDGVSASIKNGYYPGDNVQKMKKLAHDINCELVIDDDAVTVMPAGNARSGNAVLLSKDTGMIGYPTFNQNGVSVRCFFNPAVRIYGKAKIESIVPKASGEWIITKLVHNISAYDPKGGKWETALECSRGFLGGLR